ncbi:YicC/YloC family endoribonuclease [Chitinimonas viridis]|uniref:YicC/YloC family endoribonuclease n=1 Tax=Chitinimonas viridis TaxID=664880 RepID=A0ABT8B0X2_9NEIS|nr:YicC/YloC family endoribonuclease [Chitinimonas viridis]MDN3575763.1 YicC/YloC family endoribonuclease [Chitinimonas viridis]
MILSMTGYAVATRELAGGLLSVELRAVNHRFLDLNLRLPEELRLIENQLREKLAGKVSRGKLDCRVGFSARAETQPRLQLNTGLLAQLVALSQQARDIAPQAGDLKMGELLRWPGVLATDSVTPEAMQQTALELLDIALADFAATRGREGAKLADSMLERIAKIETIVTEVQPRLPTIVAAYDEKLKLRLVEALGSADDDRVRQEVALFAQKIDVAEELTRLSTHIVELRRILKTGGAVGKRLDFLMQELHREANTLGSKSVAVETSQASLELKVLIEQMREQVQNIE